MESDTSGRTPATDRVEVREQTPMEHYAAENPLRLGAIYYTCELCKRLPIRAKNVVYRRLGVDIGDETVIAPDVVVDPFHPEKISIGDGTIVGWGTKLLTHEGYADEWHVGPVDIGDDVTLGHGSSTRPGVTIGDGATVAANSFVNRDVEPGARVGGCPIESIE